VRLGGELDLLDAPGIIPAAFNDQAAAQALAICNDIGEASYVDSLIAAAMIIRIKALPRNRCGWGWAGSGAWLAQAALLACCSSKRGIAHHAGSSNTNQQCVVISLICPVC
jgi:hypothetical protein